MRDEILALLERIRCRQPAVSRRGTVDLRLFDTDGRQVAARTCLSADVDGLRVLTSEFIEAPDATVSVRWEDLRRLFTGEDNIQDLTETRRARVKGDRFLALAVCQAMMEVWSEETVQDQLSDRLRRYPNVQIHADFAVQPFDPRDAFSMPVIINAFNRLTCLMELVTCLRRRGYDNLYVIDNASTYPPLLDYYQRAGLRVFFLSGNVGCYSLWRTDVERSFDSTYYALTDPDVLPIDECPNSFVAHFLEVLHAHPHVGKVGFGIKIDDIPDDVPYREQMIGIESLFWRRPLGEHLYAAAIDTTFAVYRPGVRGGHWVPAIRTAGAYLARHAAYYDSATNLSDEERYYRETCRKASHWSSKLGAYPFGVASD
jgi:hypothetical protein